MKTPGLIVGLGVLVLAACARGSVSPTSADPAEGVADDPPPADRWPGPDPATHIPTRDWLVRRFEGPFRYYDGITFYVVNVSGDPFRLWLESPSAPISVRVLDPRERVIGRLGFPEDVAGGPLGRASFDVTEGERGVYQVIVVGRRGSVELATEPPLHFGLYGHTSLQAAREDQFADAYVHLPPGAGTWPIRGWKSTFTEVLVRDDEDRTKLRIAGKDPSGQVALPRGGDQVWRLSIRAKGESFLDFGRLPIILCPDVETARAIRSSTFVLPDGTILCHRFQLRIREIIDRYRRLPPEAFAVEIPPLGAIRETLLADPLRNKRLFGRGGPVANVPVACAEQNLDPESPWFGSTHVWKDQGGRPRRGNPFAQHQPLGRDKSRQYAQMAHVMAVAYDYRHPANPFAGDPALLNRAIIGALQNLLLLREHEKFSPVGTSYHDGIHCFWLDFVTPSFAAVIDDCPEDVRAVWTEGLGRAVDRLAVMQVASSSNQWTFGMLGLFRYWEGTRDERYLRMLGGHLEWLRSRRFSGIGMMPAGYHCEGGPDATYEGLTVQKLGMIYKGLPAGEIRDKLESDLRATISLFNHTIAPEPRGDRMGASSFCTRTPGSWTKPQGGAGFLFLGDDLPEAGVHVGHTAGFERHPTNARRQLAVYEEYARKFDQVFRYSDPGLFAKSQDSVYMRIAAESVVKHQHLAVAPRPGVLPAMEPGAFTREFGDEFLFVKRPSYYAFFYYGTPASRFVRFKGDPDTQQPQTGGLAMFWSPGFGTSILGRNWSAYGSNTLLAERRGDPPRTSWQDYASTEASLNERRGELLITGRLRSLPITFDRRVWFEDDRVRVQVKAEAMGSVDVDVVGENFPFPVSKPGKERLMITTLDARGTPVRGEWARALMARTGSAQEVHLIVFDRNRRVRLDRRQSTDRYGGQRESGYALVMMNPPRPARPSMFAYSLVPCRYQEVAARVRALTRGE